MVKAINSFLNTLLRYSINVCYARFDIIEYRNLIQSADMQNPRVHALLLCILATITLVHGQLSCISDGEVEEIAQRWLNAFATGGLSTLSSAVTENVRESSLTYILTSS